MIIYDCRLLTSPKPIFILVRDTLMKRHCAILLKLLGTSPQIEPERVKLISKKLISGISELWIAKLRVPLLINLNVNRIGEFGIRK